MALFENDRGRFPLYPGQQSVISYSYTVDDSRWGPWFQRAVRLPTRRLSVDLVFPAGLDPVVWGTETSATAEAVPLRTRPARTDREDSAVDNAMARLSAHEIDHLNGMLYTSRMRNGTRPIPVAEYRGTGHTWNYPVDDQASAGKSPR